MIVCVSCYVINIIMCREFNCMCCIKVGSSKVETTVECYIALSIIVRSGTIIVIFSLLYVMHHIVSMR